MSASYRLLTIDDAYAIALEALRLRQADGERVVGKKIGATSKAVQNILTVHQPDFGFLTDLYADRGDHDRYPTAPAHSTARGSRDCFS